MIAKSTKIVCTVGPSCHDADSLRQMASSGMNVVRLNFSHGSYDFHGETIRLTRAVARELGLFIGILQDLQGPKIRTGKLKKSTVTLKADDSLILTGEEIEGDWERIPVNYEKLSMEVKTGDKILLDDGNIELRVLDCVGKNVRCRIINGGTIRGFRGVNLPDSDISVTALTEKDVSDLEFGIENGVDFVALSFVRSAGDIEKLRGLMEERGRVVPIIAKIEKPEAVRNIDEIIRRSDGIMIARGDLGAETSPQEVPVLQKMIIKKCNTAGKPVITATQMLESMIHHPRPTRAEAADVANAIFDGTDAVMLSGETAMGENPAAAVRVMADIAARAEREMGRESIIAYEWAAHTPEDGNIAESVSYSACRMSEMVDARCIVSFTKTGRTAHLLSKHRPLIPIIALSSSDEVLRRLSVYWGVHGCLIEHVQTTERLFDRAEEILIQENFCKEDETVIMTGGVPVLEGGPTNLLKVHTVNLSRKNL